MNWTQIDGMYRAATLGGFVGVIFPQPGTYVWYTYTYGRINSTGDAPTLTAAKRAVSREATK